jgi:hypothetical protein
MAFNKFHEDTTAQVRLGKGFLDSGAFSVLTGQWERLPLDQYVQFVAEHNKSFELMAAPDVIGSAEQTFSNLKYFSQELAKLGIWQNVASRIVVTYHLGDRDYVTMKDMLLWAWQIGIRWLAVGGIVTPGTSLSQRYTGISQVLNIVKQELRLPFKIHLFGGYTPEYIRAFLPESVDSSTYMQKARMLQSFRYMPGTWEMKTLKAPRHCDTELLNFVMQQFEPLYEYTGITDKEELRYELSRLPDGVKFWVLNGLYMRIFEQEVRKKKPDFKYWVTVASLDDSLRYGEYVSSFLFGKMWRDCSLLAFPSFYEKGNFSNTQKLTLLQ